MRVTKAFWIAAAISLPAAPLAAQATNETAPANAVADVNVADTNAIDANAVDANLVAVPVDNTVVAEDTTVATETAPANNDRGGFPWGVLGLLGLLGLIPRLRK